MIDRSSDRPLYQQLADLLREQIRAGTLAPGAYVPSESSLMQEHALGRPAVRNAVSRAAAGGPRGVGPGRTDPGAAGAAAGGHGAAAGDEIIGRMPTDPERRDLGIDPGEPILEVTRADGERLILPAGAHHLRVR